MLASEAAGGGDQVEARTLMSPSPVQRGGKKHAVVDIEVKHLGAGDGRRELSAVSTARSASLGRRGERIGAAEAQRAPKRWLPAHALFHTQPRMSFDP